MEPSSPLSLSSSGQWSIDFSASSEAIDPYMRFGDEVSGGLDVVGDRPLSDSDCPSPCWPPSSPSSSPPASPSVSDDLYFYDRILGDDSESSDATASRKKRKDHPSDLDPSPPPKRVSRPASWENREVYELRVDCKFADLPVRVLRCYDGPWYRLRPFVFEVEEDGSQVLYVAPQPSIPCVEDDPTLVTHAKKRHHTGPLKANFGFNPTGPTGTSLHGTVLCKCACAHRGHRGSDSRIFAFFDDFGCLVAYSAVVRIAVNRTKKSRSLQNEAKRGGGNSADVADFAPPSNPLFPELA